MAKQKDYKKFEKALDGLGDPKLKEKLYNSLEEYESADEEEVQEKEKDKEKEEETEDKPTEDKKVETQEEESTKEEEENPQGDENDELKSVITSLSEKITGIEEKLESTKPFGAKRGSNPDDKREANETSWDEVKNRLSKR